MLLSSLMARRLQHNPRNLWPAAVADGLLAAEAAADVQYGGRLVKGPGVEGPAELAGHEHRTKDRQANLTAVVVSRQHQVNAVFPGPAQIVRRMTQT
jgi:hypothetical protein